MSCFPKAFPFLAETLFCRKKLIFLDKCRKKVIYLSHTMYRLRLNDDLL